ncbi:sensor histidine kinase [Puerhibacterium puerhi]|uniref:sensor histidine kinase n=1 Tax=Puerhibacterium puerhi TaxID=2692623 RepID=UPI001357F8C9|nr:histidine kinase [Puerhibacterium puerhi]
MSDQSTAPGAPRRAPRRADVAIGAACAASSVALLLAVPVLVAADPEAAGLVRVTPGELGWWAFAAGLVLQGALLAWVRTAPATILVAVAAVGAALSWTAPAGVYGLTSVAVLAAVLLAALRTPVGRLRTALAGAALLVLAGEVVDGVRAEGLTAVTAVLAAVVQSVAIVGGPLLVALVVRARRDVREARRAEQRARSAERDALVQAAVARERTAMARELHDIAAHHLSGIALMAAAIDRQIDTAPARAHEAARQVRAQSTAVLDDLRRLVGLLRDDAEAPRAVESLATVRELVERARDRAPVELRVLPGDRRAPGAGVGPLAQLAAYRTVQEALANAALHAPGAACVVEVDDTADERVVVRVVNAPAPAPAVGRTSAGGFGLRGMRERADLVGADLRYGPTAAGGWEVRLDLPREARPSWAAAAGGRS